MLFENGIEMASNNDGEIRGGTLVDKASVGFTRIVSACMLSFYDCLCGKDRKAKLEAEIKVMFDVGVCMSRLV